ncbi:MAG TPA: CHASE2 domain-containing protein, partial [Planctomycetota bacterium]|nr:CHASE2 domain-containing protein [Planctomycetota bacterium]
MLRIGGAIFFVLFAAVLSYFEVVAPLDLKLLDTQFKLVRSVAPKPVRHDVVIVGIDEETTRVLREPMTLWHAHLGRFLQATSIGGARVIGLDVVLPDRSYDAILPGSDRSLLAGILIAKRSSALVLARTVEPSGITRTIHPPFVTAAGDDALGYALLPVDYDGRIRRFDERIEWDGDAVPTLAGQMARRMERPVEAGLIDYTV